jgi:predicted membrane protein
MVVHLDSCELCFLYIVLRHCPCCVRTRFKYIQSNSEYLILAIDSTAIKSVHISTYVVLVVPQYVSNSEYLILELDATAIKSVQIRTYVLLVITQYVSNSE